MNSPSFGSSAPANGSSVPNYPPPAAPPRRTQRDWVGIGAIVSVIVAAPVAGAAIWAGTGKAETKQAQSLLLPGGSAPAAVGMQETLSRQPQPRPSLAGSPAAPQTAAAGSARSGTVAQLPHSASSANSNQGAEGQLPGLGSTGWTSQPAATCSAGQQLVYAAFHSSESHYVVVCEAAGAYTYHGSWKSGPASGTAQRLGSGHYRAGINDSPSTVELNQTQWIVSVNDGSGTQDNGDFQGYWAR